MLPMWANILIGVGIVAFWFYADSKGWVDKFLKKKEGVQGCSESGVEMEKKKNG